MEAGGAVSEAPMLVVSIVDAAGQELARAAVSPFETHWNFALYRDGVPRLVKQGETPRINLTGCPPMRANEIVRLEVRLAVPEEYARTVLWLAAAGALWGAR